MNRTTHAEFERTWSMARGAQEYNPDGYQEDDD